MSLAGAGGGGWENQGHLYLGSVGMGTRGKVALRGKEPVPTFQALGFPPKGPLPYTACSRGAWIGPSNYVFRRTILSSPRPHLLWAYLQSSVKG